ncbi:hypothetical protein C1I98_11150 [Spongiactinospora gelatinilytica]|uniref:Uncharacterized protein n=1 Tax=Spongiactinospora gelatinilytica TaxID=2666298 RepID=A0A2W2IIE7_9ACTN|nr:hypothetical protein [Spongiactinospora gelatinilytica]PZG49864.1 hypothetical protein C1I98_11150 [Spongiactinospora gelatinilytica]
MNVTEARDVQRLLAWILGGDVADEVAAYAAGRLAARAHDRLGAGPAEAVVRAEWTQRRPMVVRDWPGSDDA